MNTLIRQPLLHFLLLGAGLFLVYEYINRDVAESDPQTIVVNRNKLLGFIQYRSRAFDAARLKELIDSLPEEEMQRTIREYVREEALYREAAALQLDRNDYVARLRLIQQLEFIIRGFADAHVQITEQEIHRHYEAHKSDYWVKPKLTFAHVFFSRERHGEEKAQALARAELRKLNQAHVRLDQAPAYGDRFLYQLNYVNREPEEVASHFGPEMQAQISLLQPSSIWHGPFQSSYGAHLVLLASRENGYLPPLEAVRARVEQETRQAVLEARFEESVQSIVQAYKVRVKWEELAASQDGQKVTDKSVRDVTGMGASMGMNLARD